MKHLHYWMTLIFTMGLILAFLPHGFAGQMFVAWSLMIPLLGYLSLPSLIAVVAYTRWRQR